jgi:hypothetical protein
MAIGDWGSLLPGAGSNFAGVAGEKPIFKGDCAAVEIGTGIIGAGFSFSGKFGNAAVSGVGISV